VGFDSEANRIANEAPSRLGQLAYVYGALRALAGWKHAAFTVEPAGGETIRFSGWSVGAANSKAYGGGMFAAPDAELDDGQLDVVLCSASGVLRFLRILTRIFKGTHVELDTITVLRATSVRISADRPFTIYADGDPIGELPATIRAVPHALKVLCPAGS
jgi:diacylglycerol kinase family enzyme